ncbi:MAG: hypothetical protein FWE36_08070 [Erysipelotrichales bacterium]|nr:hypothetical protein [Erysipelotrichales bacterium]
MNAVKVKLSKNRIHYYNPLDFKLSDNDFVVIETGKGLELGTVIGEIFQLQKKERIANLKPVLRLANSKDIKSYNQNMLEEPEIFIRCKEKIKTNKLDMKLISAELTLDRTKLVIEFEAQERVDFRQLVRELAEEFKARIELKQIGSRDSAKQLGGLGPCGLVMCCKTHLKDFENVSIKMAKNQNLSLNPQKISGTCGKLLCCIVYEDETYKELRVNFPDLGDYVTTTEGTGKVLSSDVINGNLKVKYPEDKISFHKIADVISFKRRKSNEVVANVYKKDSKENNEGSN